MPSSEKVQKVMDALKRDPDLMRELNGVLTRVYEKAGVTLTQSEKAELFSSIADMIKKGPAKIIP